MIILDTCVLRGLRLTDSRMDLLRTIQSAQVEKVSVPWMVLEELAAQKALAHQKAHKEAEGKFTAFSKATPWEMDSIPSPDMKRVRQHWRGEYECVLNVIPTGESVMREALWREANGEAPCTYNPEAKVQKQGSRDAAIWLSAVEYAREHPKETVYFVSGNTQDFGPPYSYPMGQDIEIFGDRFVHLTNLDEVISRFATSVAGTDEAAVQAIAELDESLRKIARAAVQRRDFAFSVHATPGESLPTRGRWRGLPSVSLDSLDEVKTFKIAEREWCTAAARWFITGPATDDLTNFFAASTWSTQILVTPDTEVPRLELLRGTAAPTPLSEEELDKVDISRRSQTVTGALAPFISEPQYAYVRIPHTIRHERMEKNQRDVEMDAAAEYAEEYEDEGAWPLGEP